MDKPHTNPWKLLWSGQHWLNYLRKPCQEVDSDRVSLYHTHCSPVREGTVACIDIPGEKGFSGICTDNRNLVGYLNHLMHPLINWHSLRARQLVGKHWRPEKFLSFCLGGNYDLNHIEICPVLYSKSDKTCERFLHEF